MISSVDLRYGLCLKISPDNMMDQTLWLADISLSIHKLCPHPELMLFIVFLKNLLYNNAVSSISDTIHRSESHNHAVEYSDLAHKKKPSIN